MEGDHYRAKRDLRDIVLFATHSLLKDPPFSQLDLISCRNLLIYLDRELQQRVCRIFHYALNPEGYLFLGSSESADTPKGLFQVINREARIFATRDHENDKALPLPYMFGGGAEHVALRRPARPLPNSEPAMHRLALEREAPPSILVDDMHRVIHLSETAGRYLQVPGGPMTGLVTELARPEIRHDLRAALHRAFDGDQPSLSLPILVRFNGRPHRVYVQVRPVKREPDTAARHALVIFIEGEAVDPEKVSSPASLEEAPASGEAIRQLTEELHQTRAQLFATREESEATNEELRAANEELHSINEEYRSTSEELETSKEELQSINEELQTVNHELKTKLEIVSRAHSDLENLIAVADFGTLFLNPQARIKWFTPNIKELMNVTVSDEGRPISDFNHKLNYADLADDIAAVVANQKPIEREVSSRTGEWYLVRIRPYRTVDDKIDGVVVNFVDVTQRRRAEEALRQSEQRLRQQIRLVDLSSEPILVWDIADGIVGWNRGCETVYGYMRDEVIGQQPVSLLATDVPGSSVEALKLQLLEKGSWSGELGHVTKDGRKLSVEARLELFPMEGRRLVLETARDVSDRKRWERRQQLLLSELTHRVKNTLTVVQSMAYQTLRSTQSREDFVTRFEGRLAALASAHKLLVDSDWQGAELGALARAQLEPYVPGNTTRLRIGGPRVLLPAPLATPFGLILHELATNAAKHGALSAAQGTVTVGWEFNRRKDGQILLLEWQEAGGPEVDQPQRTGFGRRLIEHGLPGAVIRHEFHPKGVHCCIELRLLEAGASASEKDA